MRGSIWTLCLLLAACGPVRTAQPVLQSTPRPTVTLQPSETPTPSPTVGYQSTAFAAQSTADAASRQLVQATSEHEQRDLLEAQLTAEAEQRAFQVYQWTATAAPTAQAATQTAQAMAWQIAQAQGTQIAAGWTATAYAPTALAVMERAQLQLRYQEPLLRTEMVVKVLLSATALITALAVLALILVTLKHEADERDPDPEQVPARHFVLQTTRVDAGGFISADLVDLPEEVATRDDLERIAQGLQEGLSFSRAQWTGSGKPLSRDRYELLCDWLVHHRLATRDPERPQRGITLTPLGRSFFEGLAA